MVNNLKEKILSKKELEGISKEVYEKVFEKTKQKNPSLFKKLEEKKFNERSKEFEEFKKLIRKKLREIYGVFSKEHLNDEKRQKLIQNPNEENIQKILKSHQSTYERINYYKSLYSKILENKTELKIMDLGCGFNPFSFYMIKNNEFLVSDISQKDLEFIEKFFKKLKMNGKTLTADLTEEHTKIGNISEKYDYVFLFKVLDSLESLERGTTEKLLSKLKSKNIIISFPKKTISGKSQLKGERKWFKKAIKSFKIKEEFELGTEKYYWLKHLNSQE